MAKSALATISGKMGAASALGIGLGTAVGFGTSVGLGNLYVKYKDKWYGKYLPYIVALAGKATAVGLALGGGDRPGFVVGAHVANDFGQSGVNALGLNWGVKMQLRKKKLKAVVVDETAQIPNSSVLGALNPSTARGMDRQAVDALYNQYV